MGMTIECRCGCSEFEELLTGDDSLAFECAGCDWSFLLQWIEPEDIDEKSGATCTTQNQYRPAEKGGEP